MAYNIKISPQAHNDIANIKDYVKKDGESIALNQVTIIYDALETLSEFPNIGKELCKFISAPTDYKFKLINGTYLVFYKVNNENIEVYRILRAEQDYISVLGLNNADGENA